MQTVGSFFSKSFLNGNNQKGFLLWQQKRQLRVDGLAQEQMTKSKRTQNNVISVNIVEASFKELKITQTGNSIVSSLVKPLQQLLKILITEILIIH